MELRNFLIIIGAAVGAGIFALPQTLIAAGFVPFALLLIGLAISMGWVNYAYYQVVQRIPGRHQLPGYVLHTLGKRWSIVASVLLLGSTMGALLAYLSLGGQFVANFTQLPAAAGSLVFFLAVYIPFLAMGRSLELWDYLFSATKILLFAVLIIAGVFVLLQGTKPTPFTLFAPRAIGAFGPILFSLTSFSIIPELKRVPRGVNKTLIQAQLFMVVLYLLFACAYAGIIADNGAVHASGWLLRLIDGAGLISVYTPSLLFSWVGYDLFTKDLGFNSFSAKGLVAALPLLLFVLGITQFSLIVGITGGVFLGAIGIMIMYMYDRLFPGEHALAVRLLQALFFFGICLELFLLAII